MTTIPVRALIVEDAPDDAELMVLQLSAEGFDVDWKRVDCERDYLSALDTSPDVVLADWSLPHFSGLRALELMRERGLDIPFIIVSGSVGEEAAVDAMRQGAHDHVLKGHATRLGQSVRHALEEYRLRAERRQAQVALQTSERRYRALFEGVSEIVFGLSAPGTITLLNPFFERITGWSVEEWIGRPFWDLLHPDDRAAAQQEYALAGAGERDYPELRVLTKTGDPLVVEITAAARVEDGLAVDFIGFAHDITARKQAEEDGRRRYAELEALQRASQQLLAAARDPEETYIAVHQAVAQLMPCDAFAIVLVDDADETNSSVYLFDQGVRWPNLRQPRGQGLGGYVIPRGEAMRLDDVDADAGFPIKYFGSGTPVRSLLAVPFRNEGRVVGMLSTQSYRPGAFDARHLLLFETLAAQFSAAIRNAYLYQEEQARLHEMELIISMGAALRVAPGRAEMSPVIIDQLMGLLEVDGARLEILDPTSGDVTVELGGGVLAGMTGLRIPSGMGLSAQVIATGEPYLTNEAQNEPRLYRPEFFRDCRAAAGVPMIAEGQQVIGALWIASRRMLSDHDARVFAAIAGIAANAIRRATLHEEVQTHARRIQKVVDTVPEGVLLLDEHNTVQIANVMAVRYLAVLAGIASGEQLTRLGDLPLKDLLAGSSEGHVHEVMFRERIFEVVAWPIADELQAMRWVLVVGDVTEERRVRHQQQQQERLAAVGQLAAGMAHDFNNILAVIVLYAAMAKRSLDASHPVQRWMSIINDQSNQATDLIQQMLDFSRQGDVQRQPLNLLPLLEQQVRLLRRTLPENIQVTLEVVPSETCTVLADSTRVQQVITNLALNARDAMPDGGQLRIRVEPLTLKRDEVPPLPEMAPGKWIRVAVADSGTGMPPEVREHVFDPFFTTKEPGKGTGLGLAQVYGIVAQHDGHISVETQEGKGTTFAIYMPVLSGQPAAAQKSGTEEAPQGHGETLLLVEDNATLRAALVATLTGLGYAVLEAGDGEEALAQVAAQSTTIALVLSDVVMPRVGGIALLRALRARGLQTPVILLTGHSMEREHEDLWDEGLSAWLRKPPLPGELALAVAKALRREGRSADSA